MKLDVCPAGGDMAGIIVLSAMLSCQSLSERLTTNILHMDEMDGLYTIRWNKKVVHEYDLSVFMGEIQEAKRLH